MASREVMILVMDAGNIFSSPWKEYKSSPWSPSTITAALQCWGAGSARVSSSGWSDWAGSADWDGDADGSADWDGDADGSGDELAASAAGGAHRDSARTRVKKNAGKR